jgi:hypothetical protein
VIVNVKKDVTSKNRWYAYLGLGHRIIFGSSIEIVKNKVTKYAKKNNLGEIDFNIISE